MLAIIINSLLSGMFVGLLILLPILLIVIAYTTLAPLNMFVTFGRENRIMYIMEGERFTGKVIFPSKTSYIDKNYVIRNLSDLPVHERLKHQKNGFLGMYWVGIYPFRKIYFRRQQWSEWDTVQGGERIIKVRDESTPYLIAKPFEYAMVLKEAEDKNGQPLNVYYTVILKPTHATRPIFEIDDSHGQIQTLCNALALQVVKENSFAGIGADSDISQKVHDDFSSMICTLNSDIPGRSDKSDLSKALGYYIEAAKLSYVELAGANKEELLKASTTVYVAKQGALAKEKEAEGEKKAAILKAEGQRKAGLLNLDVVKSEMKINKDYFESIKDIPGAMNVEIAKKVFTESKLTTYAGKDVLTTIDLKGDKTNE